MNKQNITSLKKQIYYRCSHTGTKETDLLFNKLIVKKIEKLDYEYLKQLSNLFIDLSDQEIFLILKNNKKSIKKYNKLFNFLKNE
tara:strand:+ start:75 stop:329 length:255 start_codon:yes stop_codon:yes gene_type:complete